MQIKVLHITSTPFGIGGVENLLISMAENYNKERYKFIFCNIFTLNGREQNFPKSLQDIGVETICLFGNGYRDVLPILFKLIKIIRKKEIDIVHTWMFHSNFLGQLAAFFSRVPVRIISRQYKDFLYLYKGKKEQIIDLISSKLCNHVIACSEGVKGQLINIEHIHPDKVSVIYNSVDLKKMFIAGDIGNKLKEQYNLNSNIVIGIVSRLVSRKGHIYLLEAIKTIKTKYSNIKLLFVGDGSFRDELVRLTHSYLLEKDVIFLRFREDIPQLLSIMDIVAQPSLEEGFGITIIEAMAMSKPVVGSKVGGIPEIIEDGITGILVPPADVEALASAIADLIECPEKRREFGIAGRVRVEKKFTVEKMIKNYEKVYEKMFERVKSK